jgi:F-type H+-transporting ATPase subunit b
MPISFHGLRPGSHRVLPAVLVLLLISAPYCAVAQAPARAPSSSPVAGAPMANSATSPAAPVKAEETDNEETALLHSPAVRSFSRFVHLDEKAGSLVFMAINFAIIFLAIVIPLGRLLPRIFRKRSQTLKQDLQTARDATAEARSRLSAIEEKLAGLGEEIRKFRDQVEQDSLDDEKRIKAAMSEESARIVAAAEQEIGAAAALARRELRNFAAALAIDHAEKQLSLTPETDRALIAEFVAGASAGASGKGGSN